MNDKYWVYFNYVDIFFRVKLIESTYYSKLFRVKLIESTYYSKLYRNSNWSKYGVRHTHVHRETS